LLAVAGQGLLVAAVLVFVARPVTVAMTLFPFRFSWRELVFISWVGLKGAVPITLATFPLMYEIEGARELFDVVFFVVVVSAVVQGWTMPFMARWLHVDVPSEPPPPVTLEISSLRHVDGDIVDYTVDQESRAVDRLVRELALPEGVVIAMITRHDQIIPPHGNTRIEAGDHVVVVLRPDTRPLVNKVFARGNEETSELPVQLEFPLRASITVSEMEDLYGIPLKAPAKSTLDEYLRSQLPGDQLRAGAAVVCRPIVLYVRGINSRGLIERVGMVILASEELPPEEEPLRDAPTDSAESTR
jgi:cell volume regulation protein A